MTSAIPRGWVATTLGEIGEYVNGRAFKAADWSERGRIIIRIQDLTGSGKQPNRFEGPTDERHTVRRGDFLISWAATLGAYLWAGDEAVLNQHIFKVNSHIDRRFHYYLVQTLLAALLRQSHGSGMVHITKSRFESTLVSIPPLAEQRRIVAAIEEHLSRLDAAVAELRRVQAQLPRYRAAVLKAAVEENPGSEAKTVSLGSLLREPLRNGHSAKKSETGTGVRTLTLTAVTVGDFRERNTKLTVAEPNRVRDLWLESGDILVERSNTGELVGTARQYTGPPSFAIFPDLLIRIRLKSEHSPRFVEIALQALHFRGYFRERASGIAGSMPKIDQGDVAAAPIPLLPTEEQRRRVAEYDEAESVADSLTRTVERVLASGAGMRQAILRRAFEGKLVPQDPNDERASVLLERIRTARAATPTKSLRPRRAGTR